MPRLRPAGGGKGEAACEIKKKKKETQNKSLCWPGFLQKEFLRWKPTYRIQQGSVSEQDILRMVRLNLPEVKRTKSGFLKGLGVK